MRIEQIRQILEIIKCGSIGKAAQQMYMQQSNLSMVVKSIEEEFHQPIFYRTPNGVSLTSFGKDFAEFAESYYKQYQLFKQMGENSLNEPIEEFNICSHHMTIARWAFSELCRSHSEQTVHLCMNNVSFEDIPRSVASHQYDIGILGLVKERRRFQEKMFASLGLEFIPLGTSLFHIIVGNNHPFVQDHVRSVTLNMCKAYPFLLYRPMGIYLNALESYQKLINCRTLIDVPDYVLAQDILQQGKAFSVGPLKYLYDAAYQPSKIGLSELPFEDHSAELYFGYIKRKDHQFSELGQEYVSLLSSAFAKN